MMSVARETTKTTAFTPSFEAEDDEVVRYRSVSVLAILGLLLGIAAPICAVAPLLMVVPIVGAVVSLVAMRRIAESDGALIGRGAAVAGLVLCVASAAAALARNVVTEYLRTEQAEVVARQWIERLQAGQIEPAYRLTVRGASPPPPPSPEAPPGASAEDPFEQFQQAPVVEAIQAAGESANVEFAEDVDYVPESRGRYYVVQRYLVTPEAGASPADPFDVTLTLERTRVSGERGLRWLVAAYSSEAFPADTAHQH